MAQKCGSCRMVKEGEVQNVHFLSPKGTLFWVSNTPLKKKSILATGLFLLLYVTIQNSKHSVNDVST